MMWKTKNNNTLMSRFTATVALISIVFAAPAFGSEIFRWVDADGVVNFSDWAPEDRNVEVSKLYVRNSNPPGYDPKLDDNSILEQAERTNDRWSELKEQRDERRKEQQQAAERAPRYTDYDYPYYPYYYRPGYYFPPVHRPGFGHRPPFKTQIRQAVALDRLGLLSGPRPHSINSSAHLARVNAGKSLGGNFPRKGVSRGARSSSFKDF